MANEVPLVEPKTAAAVPPAVEPTPEAAATAPAEAGIPDEVLQVPAMQGLLSGQPAALSANLAEFGKRPEAALIAKNKDALMAAGLGTYRSLSGDLGILFNRFYIAPEEIQAADKEGKLAEIAPPFDVVNAQLAGAGEANPVMNAKPPGGLKTAPAPVPPQSGSVVKAPTADQTEAQQASRLKALTPGGPTSGPKPGAGRLLNNILRPVL